MRLVSISLFLFFGVPAFACSIFMGADGKNVLVGNNEDDPLEPEFQNSKISFHVPQPGRKFGSLHLSFPDNFPQGGMNTAGLFFDVTSIAYRPVNFPGLEEFPGGSAALLKEILGNAATVDEAVKLVLSHSVPEMAAAQLFFADRNGDGALIGVGKDGRLLVTKKQGNFLLATNFDVGNPTVNANEPRYKLAMDLWQKKPDVSLGNFRSILAAIHFEASPVTLYSNIYDLKRGTMVLYHFHNYADAVKIDLKQELAKGERTVKIEELFPNELKAVGHTLRVNAILKCVVKTKIGRAHV